MMTGKELIINWYSYTFIFYDSWLEVQSYQPGLVESANNHVEDALRDQIMDFEKEYKDVTEIVKKEQIMRSISTLLENSKSC